MGQGDLDGDIYWISWRQEFVDFYQEKSPEVRMETQGNFETDFNYTDEQKDLKTEYFNQYEGENISDEEKQIFLNNFLHYYPPSKIGKEQCIRNFIDYLRKDILGQIANLHCKISDLHKENIN
mmetsp:Transcript_1807/g.1593  ORF Transcript_1807/g.1593 Transcript_1807/m.1593 type:complete len:123 (+) Transcript_1807:353-721(+)